MSYKHNNLMAMRHRYWDDHTSPTVLSEKESLKHTLEQLGIFQSATLEDAKYVFFTLPSIIIVKGYALGFSDHSVKSMIHDYLQENKSALSNRISLKVKYRMTL